MASVGSAVFVASNTLRDKFIRTAVVDPASPLSGAAPQNIMVTDGRMYRTDDPTRGETYQDLLRRRGWPSLDTQQTWTPDDADKRFSMYAYGAVFAEVGVDESLGRVRIRRIFGVLRRWTDHQPAPGAQSGDRRDGDGHRDGVAGGHAARLP